MKKVLMSIVAIGMCSISTYAVQADGANFCADDEFSNPVSYIAIRDANSYGDAFEQALWKGHKVKKGTVVKVYAIGKNCNDPKTIFMNTDDIGFTGVKMSDFKKVK